MQSDLLYALRALARAPVLATVIVLSLGVGIGVNTVVFSWIQALVFRPIPGVADASTIYLIEARSDAGLRPGTSWPEFRDLSARIKAIPDLAAFRMIPLNVGEGTQTERTYALLVSGNYFSSLGLRPAVGRLLQSDDVVRPGGEAVVVVSYDYWQTRLGGDPAVVGRSLRANDVDLTIVGVTPDGFQGTVVSLQFDLWAPATMAPVLLGGSRELEDRAVRGYSVMGRLNPDVTRNQAQAEVSDAMRQLAVTYPETNATTSADVVQFWRGFRGPVGMLVQALAILQGVMLLLLLAVCGNTANLILARASTRQREIGVRLAVGAGTARILRLLLVENLVLGIAAAGVGALITFWGTNALRATPLFTIQFPVRFQTSLNEGTLAFAVLLGIACALAFGAAPALHLARVDPQAVLRSGSAVAPRSALRNALMAVEVALAVAVLLAAALFYQSFQQTDTDPGFRRDGVLLAAYDFTGRNMDAAGARLFATRLLERLRAVPAVEAAAISSSVPLDIHGLPARSFVLEGRPRLDGTVDRSLSNTVTPGYFAAMGIPLLAGSDFAELSDTTQPAQAIVNDAFVRQYIGDGEAIGRRLRIGDQDYTIAGIVRHSLYESFSEPPTPIIYLSYRDRPVRAGEIHVRTRLGDESMLAPAVRRAVREVDPSLPVYSVRTLTEHVDMNLVLRRIPARMFIVLGPLMLILAAIGIYAVVAYSVAHRSSEIGVRVALGASATRVVNQIVGENFKVICAGAIAGWLPIAYVYTHLFRQGLDVAVFVGVPVLLLVVAVVASWVPARRAGQVDPMVALRTE
jgi:predicted permease